jgi:3-oxoacyl-[acyl-carrier protein] reductase
MDLGLQGRRALVFGSSSGSAEAVAAGLVAEGAMVGRDVARRGEGGRGGGRHRCRGLGRGRPHRADDGARASSTRRRRCSAGSTSAWSTPAVASRARSCSTDGADDAAYRSMLRPALEVSRAAAPLLVDVRPGPGRSCTSPPARSWRHRPTSRCRRCSAARAARWRGRWRSSSHRSVNVNVIVTGQFDTGALARFEAARAAHEGRTVDEVRAEHVASIPLGSGRPRRGARRRRRVPVQ